MPTREPFPACSGRASWAYSQLPEVRDALARQLEVFSSGLDALDPAGPTACEGWTVADLDNHMASNLQGLAAVEERRRRRPGHRRGRRLGRQPGRLRRRR